VTRQPISGAADLQASWPSGRRSGRRTSCSEAVGKGKLGSAAGNTAFGAVDLQGAQL